MWVESNVQLLEWRQPSGRTAELLLVLWTVMMKILLPEGFSTPSESFSFFRLYLRSALWPRQRRNSCVTEPARDVLPSLIKTHNLCVCHLLALLTHSDTCVQKGWGAQSGPQGPERSLITGSARGNWTWFVHF